MILCYAITKYIIQSLFSSTIQLVHSWVLLCIQPNTLLLRILPCSYSFSLFISRMNDSYLYNQKDFKTILGLGLGLGDTVD